jgi:hypothetical protein
MSLLDEITDLEQRARARMNELEPLVAEFHELEQFLARLAGGRPEAPATRTMAPRSPSDAPLRRRPKCQRPSVSPQRRPSDLPGGGHLFSPLVAIGSPQRAVVAEPWP